MAFDRKKVGIITFHASYNCGSMLQAYALQKFLQKNGYEPEMIDFSSEGQRRLYSIYAKRKTLKNLVRNSIFFMHKKRIVNNFSRYENFKQTHFNLTEYNTAVGDEIIDRYDAVIAGADQIWNVTISDYDDAYFLNWVKNAKRIAYAPSFGARNPKEFSDNPEKISEFLKSFDNLSIREYNGQKWIKELTDTEAKVVLDPTLIVEPEDYSEITSDKLKLPKEYIFYYSPSFSKNINLLVKKISKKYSLPVIAFNAKSFYTKGMNFKGFKLPDFEDPTAYLQLMKNASMVITTSFHGCIFSTVFKRNFWVVKNGGMFGTDDRVLTLLKQLAIEDRMIQIEFDDDFDYLKTADYSRYEINLSQIKKESQKYLLSALEG